MLEKNSLLHHRSDESVLPQQAHGEGRTLVVAVPLCSGWMPRSHFSSSAALLIKLYIGTKWKAEMKHPFVLMQQSLISSEQHYQICPSAPTTSAPLAEGSRFGSCVTSRAVRVAPSHGSYCSSPCPWLSWASLRRCCRTWQQSYAQIR